MKTICKFGLAALAAGVFLGATLPSEAEAPDIFTRHGLPVPGVYFGQKEARNRQVKGSYVKDYCLLSPSEMHLP